jgi:hypothetical protein
MVSPIPFKGHDEVRRNHCPYLGDPVHRRDGNRTAYGPIAKTFSGLVAQQKKAGQGTCPAPAHWPSPQTHLSMAANYYNQKPVNKVLA